MNLDQLKSETRPDHESTEAVMPLMKADLSRAEYAAVLAPLYSTVDAWESWAASHAPADLTPLVMSRQRSHLIAQDLAFLQLSPPAFTPPFQPDTIPGLHPSNPAFRASFLGAMYVMEGSTLGGQYIARHLEETLHLQPGQGDAYFRGYGDRTGEMWRSFKSILADLPDNDTESVIAAARAMFGFFRASMMTGV